MSKEEGGKRDRDNPWPPQPHRDYQKKEEEDMRLWGILIFGLIGATATTFAVTQLRRTADWVYSQLSRSQSSWKDGRSFRSSFQEEAWKRYNRRMKEEYEEEMERVERIRRMQSVFNRERNKFKRTYESWQEHGPGAYHQHYQRNDWYWKADTSFRDHSGNFGETPRARTSSTPLSHHYSVLGLDSVESFSPPNNVQKGLVDSLTSFVMKRADRIRCRTKPYTDDEIKSAFRTKAKQFHPDQNQDNKVLAEAKFKEVMVSYEAIKSERKNNGHQ
ncbi:hypothetical protein BUALT_Bualt08G0032600 [Buddleja alternifolia]|uniref:J domain-containing protein n=1 Tax=Buddleja alternifolia TaxID=168488 RepID=A0AAV6X7D0_9LAMI|nr:hypothetical protein BUALT_Bualt08G0032600 [Buddleja alternifolia]